MAAGIQPSATLAAGAKARQLKAEGVQVFDFSLGEPDFPTPEHICRAAYKAMQDGHTHYTPAAGIPELRSAIARLYQKVHGLRYGPDQIVGYPVLDLNASVVLARSPHFDLETRRA